MVGEGKITHPPDCDGDDAHGFAHSQQRAAKAQVRVIIGHENIGMRPVDDEKDCGPHAFSRSRRQILEVPGASGRDRVGEHGDSQAEKRARLDFEKDVATAVAKKKIEPAAADGYLLPHDGRALEAGDEPFFKEMTRRSVRLPCMKHDGAIGVADDDTDDREPRGPAGGLFLDDKEAAVREKELLQPPRIGEVCPDQTPLIVALDQEAVGAPDEAGVQGQTEGAEEVGHGSGGVLMRRRCFSFSLREV